MKSAGSVRAIISSPLLSYVYFNPIFQASRLVRKKLRKKLSIRPQHHHLRAA